MVEEAVTMLQEVDMLELDQHVANVHSLALSACQAMTGLLEPTIDVSKKDVKKGTLQKSLSLSFPT